MPVYIDSLKFQDEYTGSIVGHGSDLGIDYLMGCVGDFIYASIDFHVAWYVLDANMTFNTTDKTIMLNNCNLTSININALTSQNKNAFLALTNSNSFITAGFQAGDTIVITGTTVNDGTYTISSLTDTTITVNETIASDGVFAGTNVYGATNINALDFYYNLVNNNTPQGISDYVSLTDSKSIQKYSGVTSPLYYGTTYPLSPNATSQAWFNDTVGISSFFNVICQPSVTSYGITTDYKQKFNIVFPFLVTPFFLSEQLQILQNALKQTEDTINNTTGFTVPKYFLNQCLGFICQIDARYNIANPLPNQSSVGTTFKPGNTTWFDTFFPTGTYSSGNYINNIQYTLKSIQYTDDATSNIINAININGITDVELKVDWTNGSFTSGDFVVNFMWLPTNPGEYQNYTNANQSNFRKVFLHDRCFTSIGAGSKNGDQYGNETQAIVGVTSSANATGFTVNFKIDFGAFSKSTLEDAGVLDRNYLLWITPQTSTVTDLQSTDRSAIIADVNLATYNTDDATLMTADTFFYQYPTTTESPTVNYNGYIGQYGLASTRFDVKKGSIVTSMNNEIIVEVFDTVTGIVSNTFPLEGWSNNTADYYDGNITQIDIAISRGFSLDTNNPYNIRSISRAPENDTSTTYAIFTQYPFQIGYQYWITVPQFDPIFVNFHTQYWPVYTQGYYGNNPKNSFWTGTKQSRIRYKQTWNILDTTTNITTQFILYSDIGAYDIGKQSGVRANISTSDVYGNDLAGVLASDIPTTVTSVFTGVNPPPGYYTIGSITVSYSYEGNSYFDTITTLDSVQETSTSLWNVPLLIIETTGEVILQGTINFQNIPTSATNVFINSNLSYGLLSNDLVTDAGEPIITDGGDNIVVD